MNDNEAIVKKVIAIFDGRDPIFEANSKMATMSHTELTRLVLIAANRIGTLLKGGDYDDTLDAAIFLNHGVDTVFSAYEDAQMSVRATTAEIGNA
jgi:hypothetical protein